VRPFIFQRNGRKTWQLGAIIDGRRRQLSLRTSDRSAAEALLEKFRSSGWRPRSRISWKSQAPYLAQIDGSLQLFTRQKRLLAMRALDVLNSQPNPERFAALTDNPRITLLSALGRVASGEWICEIALKLCELKLSTARAVSFVLDCREARNKERTFPGELRKAVRKLMQEFNVPPSTAASYLQCCAWGLEKI
jgi:hypothetical protein